MDLIVAWTARQALILEIICPLPWEVSVPVGRRYGQLSVAIIFAVVASCFYRLLLEMPPKNRGVKRAGGGVKRTFLEDDNRRRLASEGHFDGD